MHYTIRKARPQDLEGVIACLAAALEPCRASYTDAGLRRHRPAMKDVIRRAENMRIFAAVDRRGRGVATIACRAVGAGEVHLYVKEPTPR